MEKNGTIIDHIYVKYSNILDNVHSGILLNKLSHHLPVFTCLPIKDIITKPPKHIWITKQTNNCYENINSGLNSINWNEFLPSSSSNNSCKNYTAFCTKINELKEKNMPRKLVKFNKHKHSLSPWLPSTMLKCFKKRDDLYKKIHCLPKDHPNYEVIKNSFKEYEKNLKNLTNKMKDDYMKSEFDKSKGDIKNTWATIKSILHSNKFSKNTQTKFTHNGKIIEGDLKIANEFNHFFTEIGPNLERLTFRILTKLSNLF